MSALPMKKKQPQPQLQQQQARRQQRGVALIEALIASLILAIGLLGAIGMQARAYSALSDAGMRAEATMASDKLLALMALDQSNLTSYAYAGSGGGSAQISPWLVQTLAAIPSAKPTVTVAQVAGTSRYRIDIAIGWQRKQGDQASVHNVTSYIAPSK
ncbi:type IV pilus modification PilV family protein [Massilia sp. PWRC2]|uniref:type IV pilus modification PilV family protein n=1 Tax=Massilia sp. PWRC2 TaxID=2804626 RepID=UPI003CECE3E7